MKKWKEFKISHNRPLPVETRFKWGPTLSKMQKGDSFELPQEAGDHARIAILSWGRQHGKRFKVVKEENGTRVCYCMGVPTA